MRIQRAAKLLRLLEDDDVGSVDIAIVNQIGRAGQRCDAASYKIIFAHFNLLEPVQKPFLEGYGLQPVR